MHVFISLLTLPVSFQLTGIAAMAPAAYMHNKMGPHRILSVFINELSVSVGQGGTGVNTVGFFSPLCLMV